MKKKNTRLEYFDDCAICQAMRHADNAGRSLSLPELQNAFAVANKKQKNNLSKNART